MAKFCVECPLAGECKGEIAYIDGQDIEHNRVNMGLIPRWEDNLVSVNQCFDEEGNGSELMQDIDIETIMERVEECTGPKEIEQKRLFRRKPRIVKVCGSLGIGPNVAPLYREHYERYRDEDGSTPTA